MMVHRCISYTALAHRRSASRCTAAHTAAPLACRWRRRLPRPHVFFGSSGMFGLAAALWASTLLRFKKDVHKIHLLMGALLLVKLIATCVRLRLHRPRRCVEQKRNIVAPQSDLPAQSMAR